MSVLADAKEEIKAAAKNLTEKGYSWRTTVVVPETARFRPGPTEGKTEKGATYVKITFGDNDTEIVMKEGKAAVTNQDGDWQSAADLENADGPVRFLSGMVRGFRTPAEQAAEIVDGTKELKKDGDVYSAELTEEGAKQLMRFRRGSNQEISNAKGSVKFWVKEGALAKIETKVSGKSSFNGNEFDVDRTSTTEIKEIGTTKVTIPEAAAKKLS
jgi:hypothetical protein